MISFHTITLGVGVFLLMMVSSAVSSDCRNVWKKCWNHILYDITNCEKRKYQLHCKRTCGLCGVCTDLRDDCDRYSRRCSQPWMQVSCRKTCRTCVDDETGQRVADETTATAIWTTAQDVLDMGSLRFWIVYVVVLLAVVLIGVLVVFIMIRRRGARRKTTDENKRFTGTERFNAQTPGNSDTPAGVTMASSAATEMPEACDLYNSTDGLKSPDNSHVNHGKNTSKDNEKSRSSEENRQNDVYTVVDKTGNSNDLHDYTGEITLEPIQTPSQAGSPSRKKEHNVETADSENTNTIQDNEGNSLFPDTEETGSSTTQNMTVKDKGLLYTELDFTQYQPQTQRPLPQKEETNYEAIEFKLQH